MGLQRGYIYESAGKFYIRYRENGRQKSHLLCTKDTGKHYSSKAKAVRLRADEFMLRINSQCQGYIEEDLTVSTFWEHTYLPYARENLRPSTVDGYQQIWNQFLAEHFAHLKLKEYRTHLGSQFLTALAKKGLDRNTIAHARGLASGIFSHALNVGLLESNPWHDVKVLAKIKASRNTPHYTLEEAENIISALGDYVDCQLVISLAFFLGLRPGEIQGLRWEDVDPHWIHIRRAVVRGIVGETKTPESVASLPLIAPVQIPLQLWGQRSHNPIKGWLFPNRNGKPADLRELVRRKIVPTLEESGIPWKGLYAARRGAGTVLTQLTGNAIAAQQILRHKNLAVTTGFYVKRMPEEGFAGMKLLEAAVINGGRKKGAEDGQ
jgi:integrase